MRLTAIITLIYFIFISLSGIALSNENEIIESLKWIESADAVEDVKNAISRQDYRFIGIAGYGIKVPGLPDDKYWEYTEKYGINVIKGTSDVIYGDEHARLIRIAENYAEIYNNMLLQHLTKSVVN